MTGGKQLNRFVELVKFILIEYGVPESCVYTDKYLQLPGFYRPNKQWDLLVVKDNKLLVAIEFKSQVGPSFGNNFNNRTEEAMGSALDLWTAYREGIFGEQQAPWLGYMMVLEECTMSIAPVKASSKHFPVMEEFIDASYEKRYEIFCKKLMLERQYSAACFLTTKNDPDNPGNYSVPIGSLSFKSFVSSMLGYVGSAMRSI